MTTTDAAPPADGLPPQPMEITPTAYDDPVAVELTEAAQQFYIERYGGRDATPMATDQFTPPQGAFLVGRVNGVPMACGGWRGDGGELAEIKRMFIAPAFRRRGYSRVLLAALEESARQAGMTRMRLETGNRQPEAIALYASSGYERISDFGYYREHELSTCFGKSLI